MEGLLRLQKKNGNNSESRLFLYSLQFAKSFKRSKNNNLVSHGFLVSALLSPRLLHAHTQAYILYILCTQHCQVKGYFLHLSALKRM